MMKVALANPRWAFGNSNSSGCCEPHLLLELNYPTRLLKVVRQESLMRGGHVCGTITGAIQSGRLLASNALEAACRHG